jgi:translation initiation factor 2 beta subunit (eIF-2beta)/eIF-5
MKCRRCNGDMIYVDFYWKCKRCLKSATVFVNENRHIVLKDEKEVGL